MENKIRENIESPDQLEALYQADKNGFKRSFLSIYSDISESSVSAFWKARLEFDKPAHIPSSDMKTNILWLIVACLISGLFIKIPQLFNMNLEETFFYEKNAGLIVLFGLSLYSFFTKKRLDPPPLIIAGVVFCVSAIYINFLPSDRGSDSVALSFIHLPLFLWCLYGLIFIDFDLKETSKRIDYIRYNGDLVILIAIILIAGGILTGVTIGLFYAIDLNIERFYFDYIVFVGLVSAPIVATYVIKNFPAITNKIAPIIARLFSPLVLITLFVFLLSMAVTGKDPYNDREFLIVFNLLLLGVMAIIVFSVSETSTHTKQRFNELTLFMLTILTLIVDLVALSAIIYRLGEYGITPNRVAVLGSNLLFFGNLLIILMDLYRTNFKGQSIKNVELSIARYLPLYTAWTFFMTFGLPLLFGFK